MERLSLWGICEGNLGLLKVMYRKALEMGVFLHNGPIGGPGRGRCFTEDFERMGEILLYQ